MPADGLVPSADPLVPADEPATERWKRISDHLVRLVQILFGVVVGQSLVLYREVVVSPFEHDYLAASLALVSIYVMIVWSWMDWNMTTEMRPYDLRRARTDASPSEHLAEHTERWRLYVDLAIVTVYAYVLFQVAPVVGDSGADIRYCSLGTRSSSCSTCSRAGCGSRVTAPRHRTWNRSLSSRPVLGAVRRVRPSAPDSRIRLLAEHRRAPRVGCRHSCVPMA
jgi:hypothetical protein